MSANPALACVAKAPLVFDDILRADIVVKGDVVDYDPGEGNIHSPALITLDVEKAYRGDVSGTFVLAWPNSTFSKPKRLEHSGYSNTLIVAAVKAGKSLPLRSGSAPVFAVARPELYQVAQAPCAPPLMFKATPDREMQVKVALSQSGIPDAAERERLLRRYFSFRIPLRPFQDSADMALYRMHRLDIDRNGLSVSDIQGRIRFESGKAYRSQYRRLLQYDLNQDGSVHSDEILRTLGFLYGQPYKSQSTPISKIHREIMAGDENGDELLTSEELVRFAKRRIPKSTRAQLEARKRQLLRVIELFDKNGDKTVSDIEITAAIREVFAIYQNDDDGQTNANIGAN